MATSQKDTVALQEGMLSPFRVLDLTEGGTMHGGKLLGDMGADVIKIERPGGSVSRSLGPFWHDEVHPERSLFWWAYNVNKRGVTLSIDSADGAAMFKRLVQSADFVLESFPPGYMAGLGLGYEDLSRINPRVIVASITPFGQTGPKANNAWSDLSVWASGGPAYLTGHPDRSPVGISFEHQAALHGGTEAAAACMIAHYYREKTGEGQYIDVSMQECAYWVNTSFMEFWETAGTIPRRQAGFAAVGRGSQGSSAEAVGTPPERRQLFPTKDGFIMYSVQGGAWAGARSSVAVVDWMKEEGMASDWLVAFDFVHAFDLDRMSAETLGSLEDEFAKFFLDKTKLEITERSVRDHFMVGPVNTFEDLGTHPQLQAREFFPEVWHQELGENVVYCGPAVKASESPLVIRRPPPRIGEHNDEIYCQELGITSEELVALRHSGVI